MRGIWRSHKGLLWTAGGLALGASLAFALGLLVFWAWPAYRRAKSPLAEAEAPPVVLHYAKESPVAREARSLATRLAREWEEVVGILGVPAEALPEEIHVYAHHGPEELSSSFAARSGEGAVQIAVVDIPAQGPAKGALARLACSLAYGGPGNPVFPRGLARYLDDPQALWAAKAAVYGKSRDWRFLFEWPEALLPFDPWEEIYFRLDAPWSTAAPTLEGLRSILAAARGMTRSAPAWEAVAAAFAQFVVEDLGPEGVKAFWLASTWERGAETLGLSPAQFARRWEEFLRRGATLAQETPLLAAERALFSGRPSEALAHLKGQGGEKARLLKALAYLALGDPHAAMADLEGGPLYEALRALLPLTIAGKWRLRAIGADPGGIGAALERATAAVQSAMGFWSLTEERLPEVIAFYLGPPPRGVEIPWGTIWEEIDPGDIPERAVRFVFELVSFPTLPQFAALVEGLILFFAQRDRAFTREAAEVLEAGRWVPLTQPLFDYPRDLAEAEAGAFVCFLLEQYGEEGIRAFWRALARGASPYRASAEVLGMDLPELDRALRDWLTRP